MLKRLDHVCHSLNSTVTHFNNTHFLNTHLDIYITLIMHNSSLYFQRNIPNNIPSTFSYISFLLHDLPIYGN